MRRLPPALWALPALGLARLLPEHGVGLYLRLAAATGVALLPGALAARAFGLRGAAPTLVWALALLAGASALTFAVSASLALTLVLLAVASASFTFFTRRSLPVRRPGWGPILALGAVFGMLLWRVSGNVAGDGFFHLARVRKLEAFGELSLDGVGEFADGGLHPGYAFPLWHAFLAVVTRLAGVDAADVIAHEASVLAPLAFLVLFEAGAAIFHSGWLGLAVLAGQLALSSLSSEHGGAFASLSLPATASQIVLVPAVLALVFASLGPAADGRDPPGSRALLVTVGAAGLVLTIVHPTYALFVALPLAGFVLARAMFQRSEAIRLGMALGAFLVPAVAVLLSLLPIAGDTALHDPDAVELRRAFSRYGNQLERVTETTYRLAPEMLSRSGSVAVAALALLPLAGLAARRRWGAFVLGGSLAVLLTMLVPELFTRLSDAVSISQSRRAAAFLPFAFAFAGGAAVLARLLGPFVLAVALGAGIWLQLAYPGDFSTRLEEGGGPGGLAWYALIGSAAALVAGAFVWRRHALERPGFLAAAGAVLFVLPIAAHAAGSWTPSELRLVEPLTPGLIQAVRSDVPEGAVVFSDLETSYRIGAFAPVYVAANPPAHVADTEDNRPYERRLDVLRFFRTGDLAIPSSYGAGWLIVDRRRFELRPELDVAFRDGRYTLYRL